MKYKGIELKEVLTPQVFDKPKEMLTWNCECPIKRLIVAIIQGGIAIDVNKNWLSHCAWIPEESKTRRATNRELAMWLAKGNGEINQDECAIHRHSYLLDRANEKVGDGIIVRKWEDTEWHEPTVDYMGIE